MGDLVTCSRCVWSIIQHAKNCEFRAILDKAADLYKTWLETCSVLVMLRVSSRLVRLVTLCCRVGSNISLSGVQTS